MDHGAPKTRGPSRVAHSHAVFFSPEEQGPPEAVRGWFDARGLTMIICRSSDDLMAMALRGRPRVVIFDARTSTPCALQACQRLKSDAYTSVVPCGVLVAAGE